MTDEQKQEAEIQRDIRQDIRAIEAATTWDAADSVARAMRGLGRWTEEAQAAYDRTIVRLGADPTWDPTRFSERLEASQILWAKWLAAHPRGVSARIEQDRVSKSAFTAGVMMGVGWAGRKSAP